MELPTTSYEAWRAENAAELLKEYRQYVREALDDAGFELQHLEDFETWLQEEYQLLQEHKN